MIKNAISIGCIVVIAGTLIVTVCTVYATAVVANIVGF